MRPHLLVANACVSSLTCERHNVAGVTLPPFPRAVRYRTTRPVAPPADAANDVAFQDELSRDILENDGHHHHHHRGADILAARPLASSSAGIAHRRPSIQRPQQARTVARIRYDSVLALRAAFVAYRLRSDSAERHAKGRPIGTAAACVTTAMRDWTRLLPFIDRSRVAFGRRFRGTGRRRCPREVSPSVVVNSMAMPEGAGPFGIGLGSPQRFAERDRKAQALFRWMDDVIDRLSDRTLSDCRSATSPERIFPATAKLYREGLAFRSSIDVTLTSLPPSELHRARRCRSLRPSRFATKCRSILPTWKVSAAQTFAGSHRANLLKGCALARTIDSKSTGTAGRHRASLWNVTAPLSLRRRRASVGITNGAPNVTSITATAPAPAASDSESLFRRSFGYRGELFDDQYAALREAVSRVYPAAD